MSRLTVTDAQGDARPDRYHLGDLPGIICLVVWSPPNHVPNPKGWTNSDRAQLERAIRNEVRLQIDDLMGRPLALARMLVRALERQDADQEE